MQKCGSGLIRCICDYGIEKCCTQTTVLLKMCCLSATLSRIIQGFYEVALFHNRVPAVVLPAAVSAPEPCPYRVEMIHCGCHERGVVRGVKIYDLCFQLALLILLKQHFYLFIGLNDIRGKIFRDYCFPKIGFFWF